MSTQDFLVEIGTEELPPLALKDLGNAFCEGVLQGIDAAGLPHGAARNFATPRRLAVLVKKLAMRQLDRQVERRGPPMNAAFDASGQPTQAGLAFAKSCGVAVAALEKIDTPKGAWLIYRGTESGADTALLLPGIVRQAIAALPIPKRMRWGAHSAEFVRPVHSFVMLLGEAVIDCTEFELRAGRVIRGHRFHAPRPINLRHANSYATALKRAKVVADFDERRQIIESGVMSLAASLGGRALIDPELLDEVTALVEWPVPIAGQFDARFLSLPREVIVSTVQDHQRYFPVEDESGNLSRWFITISNIDSRDPAVVRAGNERVVRPRLSDAAFFWDQDRKRPLAAAREQLKQTTFQTKLGSQFDKAERVKALSRIIAAAIGADAALVTQAAELAKCDLLSGMVGEFPELQGTMGRYFALAEGLPVEVAAAIEEQYRPRFAGDVLPSTKAGQALALADKLDTLAGIFAIDQRPTGTKDPFALRRAALGVLRIVQVGALDLDLHELLERAVGAQPVVNPAAAALVYEFIMERLRGLYLESGAGISTEMFDAVYANRPGSPLDFDSRLHALLAFMQRPEAANLAAANKRIANILKKSGLAESRGIDESLFEASAERELFAALQAVTPTATGQFAARRYAEGLQSLAVLRTPVDAFFDQVMVMDENVSRRQNRLELLARLQTLFGQVADFSRLPG